MQACSQRHTPEDIENRIWTAIPTLLPNMPAASDIAFLKEAEKRATELISEARDGGWRENTPVRALLSTL